MQGHSTSSDPSRLPKVSTKQRIDQIEEESGLPFRDWLYQVYVVDRVSAIEITRRHGIMFRALRKLCAEYGFEMRSMKEAIGASWIGRDDRREMSRAHMQRVMAMKDTTGENNPAKRADVRAKISEAKKRDNAVKRPEVREKMRQSMIARHKAHPEKHINYILAKRHFRSGLEIKVQNALRKAGIPTQYGQRIGSRWPDLIIRRAHLVIECDGVYWHTAEVDAARDAELNAAGWHVIHITDEEFNGDVAVCVDRVRHWLIDNGFRDHIWSVGDPEPRQCRLPFPE